MNPALESLVAGLGWALLHFLWQGLLVGLGAAAALALLRDARPQARYAVACLALALCLALPVLTLLRAAPDTVATAPVAPAAMETAASPLLRVDVDAAPTWRERLEPQLPRLVMLWAVGVALLALRLGVGLAWVARASDGAPHPQWQARLDALALRLGVKQAVRLRLVDGLEGPVTARFWRPVVLLPAALLTRLPPDLIEALLAHELAHVRRHDYLVNLLQGVAEALLFYHPVVWWLSRRIRIEREQVADDLAATALGEPRRLALALEHLAQLAPHPTHLAPAASGGLLMSRIQRLVRPRKPALDWKFALPLLGLATACVSVFAQGNAPASASAAPAAENVEVRAGRGFDYALVGEGEDGIQFSGHSDQIDDVRGLRQRVGGDFIWFRRGGEAFVIQDPALVASARAAWQPTEAVGRDMEQLGKEMEAHGEVMARLGERMEAQSASSEPAMKALDELSRQMQALGEETEALAAYEPKAGDEAGRADYEARLDAVQAKTRALEQQIAAASRAVEAAHAPMENIGAQMAEAGKPMEALGARMDVLGKQMEQLSTRADAQTRALIEQAVRDGKARPVTAIATR